MKKIYIIQLIIITNFLTTCVHGSNLSLDQEITNIDSKLNDLSHRMKLLYDKKKPYELLRLRAQEERDEELLLAIVQEMNLLYKKNFIADIDDSLEAMSKLFERYLGIKSELASKQNLFDFAEELIPNNLQDKLPDNFKDKPNIKYLGAFHQQDNFSCGYWTLLNALAINKLINNKQELTSINIGKTALAIKESNPELFGAVCTKKPVSQSCKDKPSKNIEDLSEEEQFALACQLNSNETKTNQNINQEGSVLEDSELLSLIRQLKLDDQVHIIYESKRDPSSFALYDKEYADLSSEQKELEEEIEAVQNMVPVNELDPDSFNFLEQQKKILSKNISKMNEIFEIRSEISELDQIYYDSIMNNFKDHINRSTSKTGALYFVCNLRDHWILFSFVKLEDRTEMIILDSSNGSFREPGRSYARDLLKYMYDLFENQFAILFN